jgi:hypothetical protein
MLFFEIVFLLRMFDCTVASGRVTNHGGAMMLGYESRFPEREKIKRFLKVDYPNCNVTRLDFIGDGQCDLISNYNTAACGWDGGDCCEETCQKASESDCPLQRMECRDPKVIYYPDCSKLLINIGDGFCDKDGQNSYECGWDGGDCCQESCQPGLWYTCNSTDSPFQCKDPRYTSASFTEAPSGTSVTSTEPSVSPTKRQVPMKATQTLKPAMKRTTASPTSNPSVGSIRTKGPSLTPTTSATNTSTVPLTSTPVARPTTAPPTTKPTLQPLTYPPTSSPTSSCTYKLPKIITLKPFELTLSTPESSNISYLDDINLQEFTNVTEKYLNYFLSNHSIPSEERMLFDRLRLTLNLKNSSVEPSKFKAEFGGAVNVSIVSLCNETNVTLSDRQKSFFDGLVLSSFDNQHAEEYDSMLHGSIDPTVSQLSFADAREVRRVTQDSRVTGIASNTFFLCPCHSVVVCCGRCHYGSCLSYTL